MKKLLPILLVGLLFASCTDDTDNDDNSVDFSATIFTTNNADGDIRYYTINADGNATAATQVTTASSAADGVYYDEDGDQLIQASRSDAGVDVIADISTSILEGSLTIDFFDDADMESPRETAVNDNFVVVADNADVDGDASTADGRLFIYERSGSTLNYRNVITTDFKVWGITFIGDDLYAVVDADDELAVYRNFTDNENDVILPADKRVVIEGIVRTHGLTYDAATDVMVMTDIGDASNTTDDGGFHIITSFSNQFEGATNNGVIAVANQTRVSGAATLMGNPVDVAYDGENDVVYIAEAGNGGGRLLSFTNASVGGNLTPTINQSITSISSVYLNK